MAMFPKVIRIGPTPDGVEIRKALTVISHAVTIGAIDNVEPFVSDDEGESVESRGAGNYRIKITGGPDLATPGSSIESALDTLFGYDGKDVETTFESPFPESNVLVRRMHGTITNASSEDGYGLNVVNWELDLIVLDPVDTT